jgi:hypothetical protein
MSTEQLSTLLHAAVLIANIYCTSLILISYAKKKLSHLKKAGDAFWRFTFDWISLFATLIHVITWAREPNYSDLTNISTLARWSIMTVLMFVWVRLRNRPSDKTTFLN